MMKNQSIWWLRDFWDHKSRATFFTEMEFSPKVGTSLNFLCSREKKWTSMIYILTKITKTSVLGHYRKFLDPVDTPWFKQKQKIPSIYGSLTPSKT